MAADPTVPKGTGFKPVFAALDRVRAAFRASDRVAAYINEAGCLTIQVCRADRRSFVLTFDGEHDYEIAPDAIIADFHKAAEAHFNAE